MPVIRDCLDHRHAYVRRNAVLAIFTIYKNFEWLVPDGPELIANFLDTQQDMSCKRNAFLMLLHADQDRALNYLASCLDQVNNFGDILQLVIVELIYKVGPTFSIVLFVIQNKNSSKFVIFRFATQIQVNVHVSYAAFTICSIHHRMQFVMKPLEL